MTIEQAILVALIQGLTEFLPISSSAHLILLPQLLDWPDQGLVFDITTHVGSLVAVLVYFRRDLRQLVGEGIPAALSPAGWQQRWRPGSPGFLAAALGIGTIPVAVAGWFLKDWVGGAGRSVLLIAITSILFGLLLGWADWRGGRNRDFSEVGWRDVLLIGVFQALALVPGTSRSGITITAALMLGLSRPAAARFSFLLAIPIGLLIAAKDLIDLFEVGIGGGSLGIFAVGFAVAALSAFVVIAGLLRWLERQSLQLFVVYRVVLGVALVFWWVGTS